MLPNSVQSGIIKSDFYLFHLLVYHCHHKRIWKTSQNKVNMDEQVKLFSSGHCHLSFSLFSLYRFSLFSGTIIQLGMCLYFCCIIFISLCIYTMFVGRFNTLWICKGGRIKIGRIIWHFHRTECPDPLDCKYTEAMMSDLYERLILCIAAYVQQKNDSWWLQQGCLLQVNEGFYLKIH